MKHVTKENEGWNLRCVSCLTGLALTCCIIEIQLNVFSSIRHSGDIFVEHRWSVFLLNIKIKSDKYRNIMVHEKLLFLQYTLKSRRWQKPELLSGSGKTCWGYCVKKKKVTVIHFAMFPSLKHVSEFRMWVNGYFCDFLVYDIEVYSSGLKLSRI